MDRILACSDLSSRSTRALRRAALLAAGSGAGLAVLHVVDDDRPPDLVRYDTEFATALLDRELSALEAELGLAGGSAMVEPGDPFRTIIDLADRLRPDLIVMGSHRRSILDRFVGTTLERVMRAVAQPVLMVNAPSHRPYRAPLAAIDFSTTSGDALKAAIALGLADPAGLTVVHAVAPLARAQMAAAGIDTPRVEEQTSHDEGKARAGLHRFLAEAGHDLPDSRLHVATGAPAETIQRHAGETGADLLVMGTRGLGFLEGLLLGSVAQDVLRGAECDALVVPPAPRRLLQPAAMPF